MAKQYNDYKDLKMNVVVEDKQITVQTVVLDTGMNPAEFKEFVADLSTALSNADAATYKDYEQAKAEFAEAEDRDDIKNAEWKKDRLFKKWDKVSNLWEFFRNLESNMEETEGGEDD